MFSFGFLLPNNEIASKAICVKLKDSSQRFGKLLVRRIISARKTLFLFMFEYPRRNRGGISEMDNCDRSIDLSYCEPALPFQPSSQPRLEKRHRPEFRAWEN